MGDAMTKQYPDDVKKNQTEDMHKRRAAGRWRRRVMRGGYGQLFAFADDPNMIYNVSSKMKRGDVLLIVPRAMVHP